jgi:tRNA 2-thiouridine synthesizing protein E
MTQVNDTQTCQPELNSLQRDEEGYLVDADDWHPGLVAAFAQEEGLTLTPERMQIVSYVRDHFERNQVVPEARTVLKFMRAEWGEECATRRFLYRLFPRGYGQQACKMAGMRKPRKLMLDV